MLHRISKESLKSLVVLVTGFQLIGGFMGFLTGQSIESWYNHLNRSPFTPPDAAFGIVWSILYLLLAVSYWMVYTAKAHPQRNIVLGFFSFHMILNWAWTPVFFTFHALLASYILLLAVIFTAAMVAYLIWPINKRAALIFVPYILWLNFAGHLAEYIWRNN